MDFLEIRRKAKERAAARAEAARAQASAEAEARRPLALDPLPLPTPEAAEPPRPPATPAPPAPPSYSPPPWSPEPPAPATAEAWAAGPSEPPAPPVPATGPADPDAERHAAEAAAEAARVEQELEARLREMPAARDGRFLTWRPSGGAVPDVAPVAAVAPPPEPADATGPAQRRGARGAAEGGRARPAEPPAAHGDPLDDFFYREDEPGPALGALAAPAEVAPAPAEAVARIEYLTFLLGAEEYGVEIDRVREVMRSPPITEVPRAPADVLGVITVRGEVVAVFDPRGRLGLPRGEGTGGGRVIIVDDGAGPCGLLVDGVASVVRLPHGSIEPCPQGIGGASADCLEGIGRDRDRLFTVLSVAALLKPARRPEGRA